MEPCSTLASQRSSRISGVKPEVKYGLKPFQRHSTEEPVKPVKGISNGSFTENENVYVKWLFKSFQTSLSRYFK